MNFDLLSTDGFPPRWLCGTAWAEEPGWGWVHVFSDLFIFVSYYSIPLAFLYLAKKRGDIPFRGLVTLTAIYYFACGMSHAVDALIFWHPVYKLHGVVKLVTAVVSTVVAIIMIRTIPTILELKGPRQLQAALNEETTRLQELNGELRKLNEQVRASEEELRQSAEALAETEVRKNLALSASQMGTWFWDVKTDRVQFDRAELELLGFSEEERHSTSERFLENVHPEDIEGLRAELSHCIQTGDTYDTEFRFRRGGDVIWLQGRGEVLHDEDGNAVAMVGVNGDVTEARRREELLEQQTRAAEQASLAKSEFLANMSHEIRTPLAAMLGAAEVLAPEVGGGEAARTVDVIRRQGRLLDQILNDVLDLSRVEAGRLQIDAVPCDPKAVLNDVADLTRIEAGPKGLAVEVDFDASLPGALELDPLRVRQVALNLAHNAVKFTERGRVRLSAGYEPAENGDGGAALVLRVSDTGVGIGESRQKEIFEAFRQGDGSITRRHGGTGLGLSICRNLVGLMGGRIDLRSRRGEGSEFTVRIPSRAVAKPADGGPKPRPAESVSTDLRVLVAEDTHALQFILEKLLERMVGCVTVVEHGAAAVEAVRAADAAGKPFDLVLMDIQMPEMDGLEATRRLRGDGYEGPVYALTAGVMADDVANALGAGCSGHLSKPVDVDRLREVVEEVADGRGAPVTA